MTLIKRTGGLAAFAALVLGGTAAHAQPDMKDFQVLARAIGFTENAPKGDVTMGIVFDPANGASAAEADSIVGTIGGGVKAGSLKLLAEKVEVGSAAASSAKVLFYTDGIDGGSVFSAASGKGVITASTHDACLNAGNCVMVVKSKPKVDIRVSTAAAQASGVAFGSAFRMMITEQ